MGDKIVRKVSVVKKEQEEQMLRKLGVKRVIIKGRLTGVRMLDGSIGMAECSQSDNLDPYVGLMVAIGSARLGPYTDDFKEFCKKLQHS